MRRRHPIPTRWLMTDDRLGEALWDALARLPRGSGVVVRHYGLPTSERRKLLRRIERAVRGHAVVIAAGALNARGGSHNGRRGRGLLSRSVHNRREAVAAIRAGADLVFVSPVFATRSHAGAASLGRIGLAKLTRGLPMPTIALGGMNNTRFSRLGVPGIHGWAGIDAWIGAD